MHRTVLFLCLGNICRSPLAEGVFRKVLADRGLLEAYVVDSAGTGGWHVGEPPDRRSVATAQAHGIDISGQRSRKLAAADFERFAWIVAMDGSNHATACERRPRGAAAQVVRFMDYVPHANVADVPDPYYGGDGGFENVYQLLARGVGPLLDAIEGAAGGGAARR